MIDAVRSASRGETPLPSTPYVGLVPYREEDAPFFFGRDEERDVVDGNLHAGRLTILYGPSGVGKTSLLRAGVVHDLRERVRARASNGTHRAAFAVCVHSAWREEPLPALLDTIRRSAEHALGGEALAAARPGESAVEVLRRWTARVRTLLVVLDQFEDYFLYHPDDDPFASELPRIVNEPNLRVNVLISIREDAWAKLDRFEGRIPRLFSSYIRVDHLTRAAGRDAVAGPVAEWNRRVGRDDPRYAVDDELTEAVLEAAGAGLALTGGLPEGGLPTVDSVEAPFLQLVMERVWRATVEAGEHRLTLASLRALGGAERIVENHLHDAIGALTPGEQDVAADLFRFLVTRAKTKIAHAPSDLSEWSGRPETEVVVVCERLCRGEAGRILRAVPAASPHEPRRYELFHDVLAEPILDWRRQHEARRAQLAARWRLVRIVAVLAGLLVVFAALGLLALEQRQTAVDERREADRQAAAVASLALAESSRAERGTRLDLALLLGLEAQLARPSSNTRSSVLGALQAAQREELAGILHGHAGAVAAIAASPTTPLLASAGDDTVRLWDVRSRRVLGPLPGTGGRVNAVAFSADGRTVAAGGEDGTVRTWDVARRARVGPPLQADGAVTSVALSPRDGTIAAGVGRSVKIWDPGTGALRRSLRLPEAVSAVQFSPDGGTLAAGMQPERLFAIASETIRLLDPRTGRVRGSAATDYSVLDLAFGPDGRTLVAGTNTAAVRFSDARDLRAGSRTLAAGGAVAFSPDGERVVTARLSEGVVTVLDARTGRRIGHPRRAGVSLTGVAFIADGRLIAAGGEDGTVRLWNANARRPFPRVVNGAPATTFSAAFAPDGSSLATGDESGRVQLRDPLTGRARRSLQAGRGIVWNLAFSPDGGTIAAAVNRTVALIDARSPAIRARLRPAGLPVMCAPTALSPGALPCQVRGVAFGPRGDALAISRDDGRVELWDPHTPRRLDTIMHHDGRIRAIALSRDGRTLAAGGDEGTVTITDVRSRTPALVEQLPTGSATQIRSLAFSRDGTTLAVPASGDAVQLWNARTRRLLGRLQADELAVALAFAPDGATLATGDSYGTIRLWDVAARRQLGEALRVPAGTRTVGFSPDGRTLVAGRGFLDRGGSGISLWPQLLWRSDRELRERVCGLVIGRLSPAEWESLAPGIPYRSSC